jgi:hypothetical protein
MTIWLAILLGTITGAFVVTMWNLFKSGTGTLRIDRTSHERDLYRLEIDDLDNIYKKKTIVLKVDPNADLSDFSQN